MISHFHGYEHCHQSFLLHVQIYNYNYVNKLVLWVMCIQIHVARPEHQMKWIDVHYILYHWWHPGWYNLYSYFPSHPGQCINFPQNLKLKRWQRATYWLNPDAMATGIVYISHVRDFSVIYPYSSCLIAMDTMWYKVIAHDLDFHQYIYIITRPRIRLGLVYIFCLYIPSIMQVSQMQVWYQRQWVEGKPPAIYFNGIIAIGCVLLSHIYEWSFLPQPENQLQQLQHMLTCTEQYVHALAQNLRMYVRTSLYVYT